MSRVINLLQGDAGMIGKMSKILKDWMAVRTPSEVKKTLKGLFSGQSKVKKDEKKIEDIYRPENFDLIAWEYVSR